MKWIPSEWWKGKDAFVIGGGPSLRDFNWDLLRPVLTVGCNDAYLLGPSICTVCVFGDLKWYRTHMRALEKFENTVFTNQPSLHEGSPQWLMTLPRHRLGLHRSALSWGGNTGCSAINLALILGASRVFLLGFDLRVKESKTNWHDQNISKPNATSYVRFREGFKAIADDLPKVYPGRQVINLTPDSALEVFPKGNIEDYLEGVPNVSKNYSRTG